MGFIEKLQERIEKNAIKIPNVSWKDKKGNIHTEDIVIKRSTLPLIGDWARIYPPVDENGKVNWINAIFGGKKNFIKLIVILGIIGTTFFAFKEIFNNYDALKEICTPLLKSQNLLG